ncbi:MAG: hypothetical protein JRI49_02040 [Deltaproteobacteria bacterium]|nr:hypothetical protein [Deltaproteobacteria bacterium]
MRTILNVDLEYRFNDYWSALVQVRPEYDAVFDIENEGLGGLRQWRDKLQDNFFSNDEHMPLLREAWVQYSKDPWQIRLGRQIVTWGRTDGLVLLDVVNPLSTYHFILLDYADMKIPLWMANINYWVGLESSIQLLWMPTKYIDAPVAPAGSQWAFNVTELLDGPGGVHDEIRAFGGRIKQRKPGVSFDNSEVGVKWKSKIGEADYTLNYLYVWDDLMDMRPTGMWVIPVNTPFLPSGFNTEYTYKPNRIHILGGSWTQSFDEILGLRDLVLRMEAAYYINDTFVRADNSAVVKKDHLDVLWGVDKYLMIKPIPLPGSSAYFISGQLVQSYMMNPQRRYSTAGLDIVDKVDNYLTLLVSTSYYYERVSPDVLLVYNDDGDWWVKPKIKFQVTNQFHVTIGGNLFWGRSNDFFGEFADEDQFFLELKWGF